MQAARHPFEAIRARDPLAIFTLLALAAIAFGYSGLFNLGARYGFATGVEYWLFRPNDSAPAVILVLSAWLFYRRWYRLEGLPRSTSPAALILFCVTTSIGIHLWSVYTRAEDLQVISLVLAISALIMCFWGGRGLRALWLPIAFLLFAIPMPAPLLLAIVWELQMWTANFAGALLYMIGIPVLVSGDQILRATQTFQVIEGCSGLRSIETLTMLTVLMIDLFSRRGWHAALLLLSAPLVAFLLNGLRVLTLILNPHSEIVAIHNLQGIAILLVGLLLVYGLDLILERRSGEPDYTAPAIGPDVRGFSKPVVIAALGLLAVAIPASRLLTPSWHDPNPPKRWIYEGVAEAMAAWPSEKLKSDLEFRGSVRFGQVVNRRYDFGDAPVYVFIGLGDLGQRGGSPISRQNAVPGSGWMLRDSTDGSLALDGRAVETRWVEKGKQRQILHHWDGGDRGLSGEVMRSLLALDRSPWRRDENLYVARISTPVVGRGEQAEQAAADRLDRAYEALAPVFETLDGPAVRRDDRLTARAADL